MPRVYRSPVKVTTRKATLESPHPHPPYQALHDVEDAAQAAAEEGRHTAAQIDTPSDTHTPPDTENPTKI